MVLIATSAALLLLGVVTLYWRWHRMARFPILCVIHGLDQGRVYPLDGDVTRIGGIAQDSGQTNDIVIRDVEHLVSRFHCDIRKKDGSFFLVDNKSSNGTKIDGMAATPGSMVPIRKGAKIDLGGSTVLQFRFEKREKV
jgi:pSer/pThr/pTyr-binding forkhead associated (FHA) protein